MQNKRRELDCREDDGVEEHGDSRGVKELLLKGEEEERQQKNNNLPTIKQTTIVCLISLPLLHVSSSAGVE